MSWITTTLAPSNWLATAPEQATSLHATRGGEPTFQAQRGTGLDHDLPGVPHMGRPDQRATAQPYHEWIELDG